MLKAFSILVISLTSLATTFELSLAQETWHTKKIDNNAQAYDLVPDFRKYAVNGLPEGKIAVGGEAASIAKAWYSRPTTRYDHGILGDNIEGGSLVVIDAGQNRHEVILPQNEVFEDITPRLADLDGDGQTEVITIQSSLTKGASLAIYKLTTSGLILAAQTPYIGLSHRWLNIAGIDHFSGNKSLDIALVVTPHIGGRLDLYSYSGGHLYRLISEQGFSNHFIGSREQRLSASFASTTPGKFDLAIPSADRKSLMIMSVGASGWIQKGVATLPAAINTAIGVVGKGGDVEFTLGLANDSVYLITK